MENNHDYIDFANEIIIYGERIRNTIERFYDFTVTIGIGDSVSGIENVHQSYQKATIALIDKFYSGMNQVIRYQSIKLFDNYPIYIKEKDYFIHCLRSGNKKEIKAFITKIFTFKTTKVIPKYVRLAFSELITVIVNELKQIQIDLVEVSPMLCQQSDWLEDTETYLQIYNIFIDICYKSMDYIMGQNKNKKYLVEQAVEYIYSNYMNPDIGLEDVALSIYRNANYLSKIFKEQKGVTVITFLNDVRLSKAIEVIREFPGIQMRYIAEAVGYKDPFYFSRLFKKKYGVPPSKYAIRI